MANHITTKILGPIEIVDHLCEISLHGLRVDFNKLIPQPENIEKGDCPHGGVFAENKIDENFMDKDGVVCWYAWNYHNWGTKWNAYDTNVEVVDSLNLAIVRFDTAWNCPFPVLGALSRRVEGSMFIKYADEDLGYNCGKIYVDDMGYRHIELDNGSVESKDFATQLKYGVTYEEWRRELY